jgi:hypothetical protein
MNAVEEQTTRTRFRLRGSGRTEPRAEDWAQPLPPSLLGRLDRRRVQGHERLVARYIDARASVVELTVRLDEQRAEDERELRAAIERGRKPPAPKTGLVEADLLHAERTPVLGLGDGPISRACPGAACPKLRDRLRRGAYAAVIAQEESGRTLANDGKCGQFLSKTLVEHVRLPRPSSLCSHLRF